MLRPRKFCATILTCIYHEEFPLRYRKSLQPPDLVPKTNECASRAGCSLLTAMRLGKFRKLLWETYQRITMV